ncbi:unnamed protein product [Rotaria sordida]|uniref:Solute carrier family 66 member 2 n=1 Tax=Rotaria sordida TaxID=392033 RepID=A0A813ULB9_9BILA|nr:unnamed protein product [Rotaria sordida]CAF0828311.1 unnamed protein product [Rotaria sordida]
MIRYYFYCFNSNYHIRKSTEYKKKMEYFFTKHNCHQQINHHRYYSCYLFIIIAFLLLDFTNATNNTINSDEGVLEKVVSFGNNIWEKFKEESNENVTTTTTSNESFIEDVTSIFHKPKDLSHFRTMVLTFLRIFAQAFIIFGGVIPYIPQYLVIHRTRNAEGFSSYVCLTLLIANIIRIEFWFGKHFEIPLLLQSIVMIFCMLIMLELRTRVHSQTIRRNSTTDTSTSMSCSREQLTDDMSDKKFTDFQIDYFWQWTTFSSYLEFLFVFTVILSIITWVLHKNLVYVETIGFLAVFCEALLGVPQFVRNLRAKSTEGMSAQMVIFWTAGDIFKTVYFIVRKAPKQFWFCGILQISIDVAILIQVLVYSNKCRNRGQ